MSTRREFLRHTAAAGTLIVAPIHAARSIDSAKPRKNTGTKIKAVIRRDETLLRQPVHGNSWHMSWANDDRQYVSMASGAGFSENSTRWHLGRMLTVTGTPHEVKFSDIAEYPTIPGNSDTPMYHGYGILALDGSLYHFMSTYDQPLVCKESDKRCVNDVGVYAGAKLIYSPDSGRTWHNQSGSTPVIFESWDNRSRSNMLFWQEDQHTFSWLSVLQMGRNYEHNRDGYVYVYSPNGMTEGTMNELVMFRVRKAQILDRRAYEYFGGLGSDGKGIWTEDIQLRKPTYTFPRGWVNRQVHPYSWLPSVVYNAPLGLYMMANWGTATGTGTDDVFGVEGENLWFVKPSYLGLWVAPNPWGPWEQIHEEMAWMPAGDTAARCFMPQIAPKWVSADGTSFWLVWSDFKVTDGKALRGVMQSGDMASFIKATRIYMPHYAFNAQRIDLVLS